MVIFLFTQIYSNGIDLFIIFIGIFFFIFGLEVTIFSKIKSKETEIQSKSFGNEIRGSPLMIDIILTPSYPTLLKIICMGKNRSNIVYTLINHIEKKQGGGFSTNMRKSRYKEEKVCKKRIINFELDSNAKHELWVRPLEGLTKEGLEEVSKIFSKYNLVNKENKYFLNIKEPNRVIQIPIKEFTDKIQSKYISNIRDEELKQNIIQNTGYNQTINDWYLKYPSIFNEIAEIINSHRTIIILDTKYNVVRVEKPYEWLFQVGLTLITISIVIFFAGFPST